MNFVISGSPPPLFPVFRYAQPGFAPLLLRQKADLRLMKALFVNICPLPADEQTPAGKAVRLTGAESDSPPVADLVLRGQSVSTPGAADASGGT